MTRAFDIKQLIAEGASTPAERRGLEEMAGRLEDTLNVDLPYRPEFRAELRRQLMNEADRRLTPWYRRPAFMGSTAAVAAAAAVLVFGLNMWQGDLQNQVSPPTEIAQPGPGPTNLPIGVSRVNELNLPAPELPDEPLLGAAPAVGGGEVVQGLLPVKRLTARPDEEQFRAMATRLAFRGESRRDGRGWTVADEDRALSLRDDGRVDYSDSTPPLVTAQPLDADGARQAARQFLDQALLPIPGLQPVVTPGDQSFAVTYTEQVEGRPVINARTVILVSARGGVFRAESYVSSGATTEGKYQAITEADALAEARKRGGSFQRADLVWVRTPIDSTVYLQPYWRVFGTDAGGAEVARYVPALKR